MAVPYIVTFDVESVTKETAEEFSGKQFDNYSSLVAACPGEAEIWQLANFCICANNEEISLTSYWLANVYVLE